MRALAGEGEKGTKHAPIRRVQEALPSAYELREGQRDAIESGVRGATESEV